MAGPDDPAEEFHGAKAAILLGGRLLITLRDDLPSITHPGEWDLPGGGREAGESPRATVVRETREEVALDLADPALGGRWLWAGRFPSGTKLGATSWFFVVALPPEAESRVRLGDEGQAWRLVAPGAFLAMPDAVAFLKDRLRAALEEVGTSALERGAPLP